MPRKKTQAVCDRNCFECIHPDCILDAGPSAEEYREMAERDKRLIRTPKQEKAYASQKAYYRAHREQLLEKSKRYRAEHRDELVAYQRAHYAANRESRIAYQRAYRARKKAERG